MTQRRTKFYKKYRLFILCSALLCILTAAPAFLYAAPITHNHSNHNQCRFYHEVQFGEGLYKIARRYDVNARILAQVNGISNLHDIKAWDTLCIPHGIESHQLITPVSPPRTSYPTAIAHHSGHSTPQSTASAYPQPITIRPNSGPVTIIYGDNTVVNYGCDCLPTPSSTPLPTMTSTHTATHTATYTPIVNTATVTPSLTVTPSSTPTPSLTPTHTTTATASPTQTPTSTLTPTFTPTPTPTKHISHWHGEYFNNGSLIGMPLYIQHDADIDFDWQQGSPTDLPHDQFSVRWIQSAYYEEGVYILKAIADDGILVRLDDQIILDGWRDQPATEYTDIITLTAGFHELQVDYYERYGDALIYVEWGKIEG